jgi:hypothetical protein
MHAYARARAFKTEVKLTPLTPLDVLNAFVANRLGGGVTESD